MFGTLALSGDSRRLSGRASIKHGVLEGIPRELDDTLSHQGVHCVIIAAKSIEQLAENVRVAQAFKTPDTTTSADIEQKTAAAWEDNTFFSALT